MHWQGVCLSVYGSSRAAYRAHATAVNTQQLDLMTLPLSVYSQLCPHAERQQARQPADLHAIQPGTVGGHPPSTEAGAFSCGCLCVYVCVSSLLRAFLLHEHVCTGVQVGIVLQQCSV